MIAQRRDNPFPVDPTGPLTKGRVPDADLDRLIQATVPAGDSLGRLRSAIADVDPGQLEAADISALIDLIGDALDSGSEWAVRMRANDEARIDEPLPGFDW